MFSGEFCLRLKPYIVVKIASDVLTELCCQVCVLAMMFCRSDCRLCAGMCGKWLHNQETCTSVPRGLACWHSEVNMGYEQYSLHLFFTFYLNRDTSVLEFFPVIVFRYKRFSVLAAHAGLAIRQPCSITRDIVVNRQSNYPLPTQWTALYVIIIQ